VVSYLTLIDIADWERALAEMARVLRPGGRLLIANLTSMFSSDLPPDWIEGDDGRHYTATGDYFDHRDIRVDWLDTSLSQHHRPLSAYMTCLLAMGLALEHFEEPAPDSDDAETVDRYRRRPWFLVMEWSKA